MVELLASLCLDRGLVVSSVEKSERPGGMEVTSQRSALEGVARCVVAAYPPRAPGHLKGGVPVEGGRHFVLHEVFCVSASVHH